MPPAGGKLHGAILDGPLVDQLANEPLLVWWGGSAERIDHPTDPGSAVAVRNCSYVPVRSAQSHSHAEKNSLCMTYELKSPMRVGKAYQEARAAEKKLQASVQTSKLSPAWLRSVCDLFSSGQAMPL